MQSLGDIRRLLEERGLRPNKSLGQNFLVDQNLLTKLVDTSGVGAGDLVLEVGPGTGVLTETLLERGAHVVACELDHGLADLLRERLGGTPGFTLIEGDCLTRKTSLNAEIEAALEGRGFRLVANLPYGAASPLMVMMAVRSAGADPTRCLGQYVTIQREVAQRLRAAPGSRDFGELGVVVQAMCSVRQVARLGPECFWPRPKVDSEMVAIEPLDAPLAHDLAGLIRCCRMLFTRRRKQLGGILGDQGFELDASLGLDRTVRPEDLRVEQIIALARSVAAQAHPGSERMGEREGPSG